MKRPRRRLSSYGSGFRGTHLSFLEVRMTFTSTKYIKGRGPHMTPPRCPSGKASASGAEDPGFESRLRRDFSGSSHTSDLKIGTLVATLPGAWCYRVSAGTGWPGVCIL